MEYMKLLVLVDFSFVSKNNMGNRADHMLLSAQIFSKINLNGIGDSIYPEYSRKIMIKLLSINEPASGTILNNM